MSLEFPGFVSVLSGTELSDYFFLYLYISLNERKGSCRPSTNTKCLTALGHEIFMKAIKPSLDFVEQ